MPEVLDFAEITWGELQARLKADPELAAHPAVISLRKRIEKLTRFPVFDALDKALEYWSKPPAATATRIQLPSVPGLERSAETALVREVELLKRKIDELTAHLADRDGILEGPSIAVVRDISTAATAGKAVQAGELSARAKRDSGRPSRNKEILRLLHERWPSGTRPKHKLAEEARQLRVDLCELYKSGIQDGEPKIPLVSTIENIIRQPYKALQNRRNTVK